MKLTPLQMFAGIGLVLILTAFTVILLNAKREEPPAPVAAPAPAN